jgi:hypothetical protein
VNVKTLIAEHGIPYYTKIDIEGLDIIPLKSLVGQPKAPKYISLEIGHHDIELAIEQMLLLKKLGYKRFNFFNQSMKGSVKAPNPAKEGGYSEFDVKGHNTGLFGKEIDGVWRTFDDGIRRLCDLNRLYLLFRDHPLYSKNGRFGGTVWSKIYNRYRRYALRDPVSWYDVHARAD